jgi:hypothetical protein
VFDQTKSLHVNPSMVLSEHSFIDQHQNEYHWCWASNDNTTLDKEYVLAFNDWKWYEIDRTTGKRLQVGVETVDTEGNYYTYGFIDTGYMERLEYGTTLDSEPITHQLVFGDLPLVANDTFEETSITRFNLIILPKNIDSDITLLHTMDGSVSGDSFTISQAGPNRYVNSFTDVFSKPAVFHTLSLTTVTSSETKGFEPIAVAVLFTKERTRIA